MKIMNKFQKKLTNRKEDNKGFSLVELIIVIAIMAILVGIVGTQVIPYINKSKVAKDQQVLNSISTAEGAIQIAMEETNHTLHDSNILILGFGRIGKVLAKMLNAIGANVYCEARKNEDLAWIKTYGYNVVKLSNLNENLKNKDIIINTIPSIILNEEKLKLLDKNSLVIDLASKPGGVDYEKVSNIGVKVIWALALPGKVAPYSAAKAIKQTIYNEITERNIFC